MAFNNLQPSSGPYFLMPGFSMRITMWHGNPGDDQGAQWIMAHPLPGEAPCELVISEASKILNYSSVGAVRNGAPAYDLFPQNAYYRYGVTVTNWGSQGVRFNIQGGGNT
jgi:hypothetical protein